MFFILSKILYYAAMPAVWLVLLTGYALFARSAKRKRISLALAFGLLVFFTNPVISNEALMWWEVEPKTFAGLPEYETAVLLTGITNVYKSPHDRVHFGKGADRLLHTLQLYRMGKVKKILITGGSGSISIPDAGESEELRDMLLLAKVPAADIILETKSRNTYENAKFTAEILKKSNAQEPVLLVTSAFHMRRSAACFRKQGVQFHTFSTDFYTIDRSTYTLDKMLLPQEDALMHWQRLIRELLGYATYTIMGYI